MVLRNLLITVTIVLIAVTLPHALEDFHYGDLMRFGIRLPLSVLLLAMTYSLQLLGIGLMVRGDLRAALLLAAIGAIWCVGAIVVHGHDMLFAVAGYRHGTISRLLELFIVGLGAFSAWLGVRVAALTPT